MNRTDFLRRAAGLATVVALGGLHRLPDAAAETPHLAVAGLSPDGERGAILVCSHGKWTGGPVNYTTQWYRYSQPEPAWLDRILRRYPPARRELVGTGNLYEFTTADVGARLQAVQTAENA